MRLRGAIFDMDGTLLDSMQVWENAGEDYLRTLGCVPEEGVGELMKSMSLQQAALYCRERYALPLSVEEIMAGVNGRVERFYRQEARLKPGALDFLRTLSQRGVRMCLATATDLHLVEAALDRCGVRTYFSALFTCTQVGSGKDEPHIYRAALRHLGTGRADTLVFEDALYAARTAKGDGFVTVGVADAYEKNEGELERLSDIFRTTIAFSARFFLRDFREVDQFWKFVSAC